MFDNQTPLPKPPLIPPGSQGRPLVSNKRPKLKSLSWFISQSFTLFKKHFKQLVGVTGLFIGISVIISVIVISILTAISITSAPELQGSQKLPQTLTLFENAKIIFTIGLFLLLQFLNNLIFQIALILRVYHLGTGVSLKIIIGQTFKKILPFIGMTFLQGLISALPLGLVFIFYAASLKISTAEPREANQIINFLPLALFPLAFGYLAWVSIKLFAAPYLLLTENQKIIQSLRKSWQLTKGYWASIFFRFFVFMLLLWLGMMIANLIPLLGALVSIFIFPPFSILFIFLIYQNLKLVKAQDHESTFADSIVRA